MQVKLLSVVVLAALGLSAQQAMAQSGEQTEDTASPLVSTLTFVSDYRFRGISQTQKDPALQFGSTYYAANGLYAGTFISNVDFGGVGDSLIGANLEVDLFGGYKTKIADTVDVDFQLIRYNYPGDDIASSYSEFITKLSYVGITALVGYSNDVFNTNETGIYYNLGYGISLPNDYSVSFGLGRYDLKDSYGGSVIDKSIGVSRLFGPLSVGFTYVDANNGLEGLYGIANDSRLIFSAGVTF
jgi:uncharacterized protein (TIGR02001 family)